MQYSIRDEYVRVIYVNFIVMTLPHDTGVRLAVWYDVRKVAAPARQACQHARCRKVP